MSVLTSLNALVDELVDPSNEVQLLIEAARALALEVDLAATPDDNGKTKSAASAVRELRAVVEEIKTKGRRDADGDDDWTKPAEPAAGAAPVRNAARSKSGDARRRGGRGGAPAGEAADAVAAARGRCGAGGRPGDG